MAQDAIGPILPTQGLRDHAHELLAHLRSNEARFVLRDQAASYQIELNEELYEVIRNILIDISQNRAVQVLPIDLELTTVQAAEFMHVSRPYIIKLINDGRLMCRLVGTHRRIKLRDLIDLNAMTATDQRAARDEMTTVAEKLGWGY